MAVAPDPPNVQAEKVPVPLLVNVTEPVGVIAVPGVVYVMVTVQLVEVFTTLHVGWQEIVVIVLRLVTAIVAWPELELWLVSPA